MPTPISSVPGTARPLHDALAQAGFETIESLHGVSRKYLLSLHGVGTTGLRRVEEAGADLQD